MEKAWWKEAVVYQVYPRSFQDTTGSGVGDLSGIAQRLDYLQTLGVDVLWLNPIYESPNVDAGYDISDYRKIQPEFGTMEDFDRLLAEIHRRGMKLIMDLVVNHTSDQHPWFISSRQGKEQPMREWYLWRDGHEGGLPNGSQSAFSGPAWAWDEPSGQYYLHEFAAQQPDLNWENPEVREAVYGVMDFWLQKGIDGFRMDVINMISKPPGTLAADGGPGGPCVNGPKVHAYLREMHEKVLSRYDAMTVGETPGASLTDAALYAGFDTGELNMVFHFEHVDIDRDPVTGKWNTGRFDLKDLKRVLSRWQTGLYGKAWNSLYWSNHDQPRAVSRFGDASTPLFWEKSAKMLATCLHLMQGTPYIYQGEELGMQDRAFGSLEELRDVEALNAYREWVQEKKVYTHEQMMACLNHSGRDGCRTPMQWDDSPQAGFTAGTPWLPVHPNFLEVNAKRQVEDPSSIFQYYRRLISLRKARPVIVYGNFELLMPEDEQVFAYRRRLKNVRLTVLCNFSGEEARIAKELEAGTLLLGNYKPAGEQGQCMLKPYEARVYMEVE